MITEKTKNYRNAHFLLLAFFFAALIAAAIVVPAKIGTAVPEKRNSDPVEILGSACEDLSRLLEDEAFFSQAAMHTIIDQETQLQKMQIDWLNFKIWNHPEYGKIEEAFKKESAEWDAFCKKEMSKPSDYEGGTMASTDLCGRRADLNRRRIEALKRWLKILDT